MQKNIICVLFGGRSSEHSVSCVSASNVISCLRKIPEYQLKLIGITDEGFFEFDGEDADIASGLWEEQRERLSPIFFQPSFSGYLLNEAHDDHQMKKQPIDVFFPVLHGRNGEDGRIQGLFEMLSASYVGCETLSSALTMDKECARRAFACAGIPQTPAISLGAWEFTGELSQLTSAIAEAGLQYPLFVKPANAGSSIGISKVYQEDGLLSAVHIAFKEDEKILIEEGVEGRELEVAVLETEPRTRELFVSRPGEIIPGRDFYDYDDKYSDESNSKLQLPALLSLETESAIRDLAAAAFRAADCRGLARVDFFLRSRDQRLLLSEINTMPGFTPISMYPKLMELSGMSSEKLLRSLIRSAERKR